MNCWSLVIHSWRRLFSLRRFEKQFLIESMQANRKPVLKNQGVQRKLVTIDLGKNMHPHQNRLLSEYEKNDSKTNSEILDSSDYEAICHFIVTRILPGSEEEEPHKGSRQGKQGNIARKFDNDMPRLHKIYPGSSPKYKNSMFKRWIWMPCNIFHGIQKSVWSNFIFVHCVYLHSKLPRIHSTRTYNFQKQAHQNI